MANISVKTSFIKPLSISVLGGLIVATIRFILFTISPPQIFPWGTIIASFFLAFSVVVVLFWIKAVFNYIDRTLRYIHTVALDYLKPIPAELNKEKDFRTEFMKMIDELLQKCVGAIDAKPQLIKRDKAMCSLVLFPEGQGLVVKNIFNPDSKFGIKVGDMFSKDRYLASWLFYEEKTIKYNKERKNRLPGCLAVCSASLPFIEKDQGALPFRSAIGIPLKLYGKTIAALIIGSNKKKIFTEEDLLPSAIIGQYIVSTYLHLKEFCPWHRKGWRDNKFESSVAEYEFAFSCEEYQWTDKLKAKLKQIPSAHPLNGYEELELRDKIKEKCENVSSLCAAKSVFLCGNFSGWNPSKTPMERDPTENIWRCTLNLPKGEYWYQFRVSTDKGEVWLFDPKRPLWLDGEKKLQSVFKKV